MAKKESDVDEIVELKSCFIITPIGQKGSETYVKTEGLINAVLEPVLKEFGFKPVPAHKIEVTGSITKQIIDYIIKCDLVIANLTNVNPNVMYELAIRHSFGKKVLILAEIGTILPFDVQTQRTIFYDDTMNGSEELKPELRRKLTALLGESEPQTKKNSPIYEAVQESATIESLPIPDRNAMNLILSKLHNLENQISSGRQSFDFNRTEEITREIRASVKMREGTLTNNVMLNIKKIMANHRIQGSRFSIENNIIEFTFFLPRGKIIEGFGSKISELEGVESIHFSKP